MNFSVSKSKNSIPITSSASGGETPFHLVLSECIIKWVNIYCDVKSRNLLLYTCSFDDNDAGREKDLLVSGCLWLWTFQLQIIKIK